MKLLLLIFIVIMTDLEVVCYTVYTNSFFYNLFDFKNWIDLID